MNNADIQLISITISWSSWIAWLGYWAWSSVHVKRTVARQSWTSRLALVGAVLLGVFGLPLISGEWIQTLLITPTGWSAGVGSSLCIAGLALSIWSRRTLGQNWSAMVTLKERHELIQSGPYRFVRHPIYTCVLTMALGTALMSGRVHGFMVLTMLLGAFLVKMRREERLLEQHFGTSYADYKKTSRALVPFIA